jgi:glyoxylase-like metal-dependent hydrolase (beta-lactamase superfamily II)
MKKFMKIALNVIASLIIIGFIGKYFLIDHAPIPKEPSFSIDMDEVGRLALSTGDGGLPTEVRSLVVAGGAFPAWSVAAGGRGEIPMIFMAYQVVYPDKTVIIDACADRAALEGTPFKPSAYSDRNYAALQEYLRKASLILVTHEHYDHIGGIAASPYLSEILPRLLLTREQTESPLIEDAGFPAGALDGYTPVSYDRYYAAAPGIVLIKAPGHTPGQQIIYVKTKTNEYLFVGDIVWSRKNLAREVNRSLLMSLVLKEDLDSARGEIRWMIDNLYNNQNNTIIYPISHDGLQLEEYIQAGVITEGFK